MKTPTKFTLAATLLALLGWGLFLSQKPGVKEVVKTVEVVKYVDREVLVNKDVVRVETRPDGTKVVEKISTRSQTSEKEAVREISKETNKVRALSSYSLGLSVGRRVDFDLKSSQNIFMIEGGYRISQSPLWLTLSISSKRELMLGVRTDF